MRSRLWLVLISLNLLAVPVLAQKRNITEKDLFNFVWAGDTQISPDGSRVAFVRVTVNEKKRIQHGHLERLSNDRRNASIDQWAEGLDAAMVARRKVPGVCARA
jgi:hypothetical protein